MDARHCLVLVAFLPVACLPGFQKEAAEPASGSEQTSNSEPAPENENGIPWAPGEGPGETRQVGEQPRSADEPMPEETFRTTEGDGVQAGGSQRCTGKVTVPLRAEVQARTAELKKCSVEAPSEFRGSGLLKYTLRVEKDGRVASIYQLENTLKVEAVTQCVEGKLREKFEETPLSGCAQFVVPYELTVEDGEEDVPAGRGSVVDQNPKDG